jgi:hypothetical protein
VHKKGSAVGRGVADENAELSPGDVLEIALQKALTDKRVRTAANDNRSEREQTVAW